MTRSFKLLGSIAALVSALAFAQESEQHAPLQAGQLLYETNCVGCHGGDGNGGSGPALSGNETVQDTERVVNQILHGGGRMPAFGPVLSDEQIASIASYIRNNWGNDFGSISIEQVTQLRTGQQAQTAEAQVPAATVQLANDDVLGAYLTDGNGRTLYHFINDGPEGISHCYEPCTSRWLPFLTGREPSGDQGVDASLLGTSSREDNTTQVTYKGWPLYYFSGDENPGDAIGGEISDVWRVASPEIDTIGEAAGK